MARRPLIAAALCAALAVLIYGAVTHVSLVQRADIRVFSDFVAHDGARGTSLAPVIFNLFDPLPFAVMWAALIVGAVLAGRTRAGLVVALAILGATVTAEVLKHALVTPRPEMDHSWPSGHTTAVMSLSLGLVLLSPPRWRWLVAAGGAAVSAAVVVSMLVLGSHYPSDVAGGVCVAAAYLSLAAALSGSVPVPTAARRAPGWPRATG
jgi:membrane-associated phospholipid phosphatase